MPTIYGINQAKNGAQPVVYGDPDFPTPFTVSNISSNTSTNIWIGPSQSTGPTERQSAPVSPGGYLSFDGTWPVYYMSADGPGGLVVLYPGVQSVFLPSSLTFVTFPSTPPVEDASTPAPVNSGFVSAPTVTTASFTPPANSLLVALVNVNNGVSPSVTISDTGAHTWSSRVVVDNSNVPTYSVIYTAPVTTSSAITVTAHNSDASASSSIQLAVRVVTSANVNQSSAATSTNQGLVASTEVTITPTKIGSLIYVAGANSSNAAQTSISGTTSINVNQITADFVTNLTGKCTANTTVLAATAFGWSSSQTAQFGCVALEVVP
jgi:hypothetical protein